MSSASPEPARRAPLAAAVFFGLLSAGVAGAALAAQPATMLAGVVSDGRVVQRTLALPMPGPQQVRVKVRAAAVNPADWKRAARAGSDGSIPGWDIAGVIDGLGAGVTQWRRGDEVIGFFEVNGGYAQYALIAPDALARKPRKLSFEQAAGIPLAAVTAWKALIDSGMLERGQHVLIQGAAGGVGSAAVQIALSRGARVIATASPQNDAYLHALGVERVIDYNAVRFETQVSGLDMVLNTVDPDTAQRSLQTLHPGGIMVSVAGPMIDPALCDAAHVRCASVDRSRGTPIGQILAEVSRLADAGKYAVNVQQTFPLAQAQQAWDLNRQGHTRGKIVLSIPQ